MGGDSSKIEQIASYYLFQKKIKDHLDNKIDKESEDINDGYLVHPKWIIEWKKMIAYNSLYDYFSSLIIKDKLDNDQINFINESAAKNKIYIEVDTSFLVQKSYFRSIMDDVIISEKNLENFIDEKTFKELKINKLTNKEKIKYIFKKQMIIFFFENHYIIKILIHSLFPFKNINEFINLKYNFKDKNYYNKTADFLKESDSQKIIEAFICTYNILENPYYECIDGKNQIIFTLFNEGKNKNLIGIKEPNKINFNLAKLLSCRGLDNVGATCYMNATLQCLANIKPITDYLLNINKYSTLFENKEICPMTLQYAQVLIGLFCNESRTGSYRPKNFKRIISEYNPLFEGVQANDSKDLIIFLLEILNDELVKNHNKKHNINYMQNESYKKLDVSDENDVFKNFQKEFNKNYMSEIGLNLYGFQKGIFTCQTCGNNTYNFNIFNLLIFSLEATSNYYNLSNNNSMIPIINFEHCFQFLGKEETFNDTFCQKCRNISTSKYKENIYYISKYLIIILNRGKGNIFNCKVNIPEYFKPSNYVENDKNSSFHLIGIVSHLGESGMGGHFIAFCKSFKDGIWRCYNDSVVTECQNDYLQKGTPYILFYEKENNKIMGNNGNQQMQNYFNLNMNNQFNSNPNFLNNNSNQFNMPFNCFQQNNYMNNMQLNLGINNNSSNFQQNFNNNPQINNNFYGLNMGNNY